MFLFSLSSIMSYLHIFTIKPNKKSIKVTGKGE